MALLEKDRVMAFMEENQRQRARPTVKIDIVILDHKYFTMMRMIIVHIIYKESKKILLNLKA